VRIVGGVLRAAVRVSIAAWSTACVPDTVCSEGTYLDGHECRASLSPRCGPGTRLENGACVPDEGGGAVCGPGTHLDGSTCVADLGVAGNAARLFDVSLTAPAAFVNLANGPLRESFRTGENLLFLGVYEPRSGAIRIFGGGGVRNDGWYALDRDQSFDGAVVYSGDRFTSEPVVLNLEAFGASDPIRLVGTVISDGVITRHDGVPLVERGKLAGVLTPDAADAVYIESANQTLLELTRAVRVAPDVDHDGDGVAESWTMALQFSTVPIWLF
jgi:hypothetical protein